MVKKAFLIALVGIILGTSVASYVINAQKYVDFQVISQVAGKKVLIKNPIKLQVYLEKLKLYKGVEMPIIGELLDQPTATVKVERVRVVYTDQEQAYLKIKAFGKVVSGFGQKYEEASKTMNVYVYVNSESVVGGNTDVGQRFEQGMLESLFELVNYYPKHISGDRFDLMNAFIKDYLALEKTRPVIVRVADERGGFSIVREAYAVCSGDYQCGSYTYYCQYNHNKSCTGLYDRTTCGNDGDCVRECIGELQKINCSGNDSASCKSGGQCSSYECSTAKNDCSWCTPGTEVCESCSVSCGGGTKKCNAGCGNYWVTCNTQSCCTVTKPAVPGVVSPVAPFTEKSGTVTLRWSAVSSWGEECSGTGTRRYEICVGPNSSDPCTGGVNIIASGEASVSATVTGLTSAINYWKIRSINKGGGISDWSSMNNFCFWGSNSLRPLAVTDWSACDGVSHSRSRSCVAGCDCGGVDLAEVCETEVRGTIFDASFRAVCPGADVNGYLTGLSAEEYAGGAQFALVDGDNSPPTDWSGRLGATTVSNGNYSLNVYGLADYTFDFSDLAGGFDISAGPKLVCNGGSVTALGSDPLCLVQPCELVRNMSFGFNRIYGGWWQTRGGSVYAKNGVQSVIPGTFPGEQRLLLEGADGRRGALLYGNKIDNQLGNNPNARVSNWLWEKLGAYDGARYDYDFYKSRMSVFVMTPWDGDSEDIAYDGSGNDAARGYKILKRDADSVVNLAGSVPAGEKYILLVNGDVRVTSDVVVEEGGFFGVVAKGEIEMASNVARAEGFYVGNVISVPCHDVGGDGCDRDDIQFVGEGSFVGWTGINLSRDMEMGNNTASAEYFVYREDLAENAPAPMKVYSRRFLPFVP